MNPARVGIAEGSAFYEVARRGGTLRLYDLSQTSEGHKASIEFYTQDVIQVPCIGHVALQECSDCTRPFLREKALAIRGHVGPGYDYY